MIFSRFARPYVPLSKYLMPLIQDLIQLCQLTKIEGIPSLSLANTLCPIWLIILAWSGIITSNVPHIGRLWVSCCIYIQDVHKILCFFEDFEINSGLWPISVSPRIKQFDRHTILQTYILKFISIYWGGNL